MTPHEKAVEAAEQAGLAEQGCGYTIDGKQVHCDDPATDGHVDPYGQPLRRQHCECRAHSTAAITAYLASMEAQGWVMVPREPTEVMLLTQGKSRPDLAKTPATAAMAEALNREIRGHAAIVYREMIAAMLAAKEG